MYLLIQLPKQQEIIKFPSYQMQHVQYLKCYQGSLWAILILHFICPNAYEMEWQESWTEQVFSLKVGPVGAYTIPSLYQKLPNAWIQGNILQWVKNKYVGENRLRMQQSKVAGITSYCLDFLQTYFAPSPQNPCASAYKCGILDKWLFFLSVHAQ